MLQRKNGATLPEIMDKMGWQKTHRSRLHDRAMKKAGYNVESVKPEGGEDWRAEGSGQILLGDAVGPFGVSASALCSRLNCPSHDFGPHARASPRERTWANCGATAAIPYRARSSRSSPDQSESARQTSSKLRPSPSSTAF